MKRTKLRVLMVGGEEADFAKIRGLITNGETGDSDFDWKSNFEAALEAIGSYARSVKRMPTLSVGCLDS